ncbi:MAG: hypothetical protein WDN06_21380 [Asticcacaulis sp.]
MWPFKPQPFSPEETLRWHVDITCWYLRHFGHRPIVTQSELVLPGPQHYKLGKAEGGKLAQQVFAQTKALAHMTDTSVAAPALEGPAGDVYRMVVLSARRLARAVVASAPDRPPVHDRREIPAVVDVVATMMGFGVFLANHVIIDTYDYGGNKYGLIRKSVRDPHCVLGEDDLVFDIALFLTFRGLKPAGAYDYLEKHLNEQLGAALRAAAHFKYELQAATW